MAVSSALRSCRLDSHAGLQAQQRMQQLYANAQHMGHVADAARAQHGESSHEYSAALDRWNATLQYLGLFIQELVASSMDHGSSNTMCQDPPSAASSA